MNDFWLSSGHQLLDRDASGRLAVTDDFLKLYLARPELTPPSDACVVERTLHAALLADPHRLVRGDEIAAIADTDARENWTVMLRFRDLLIACRTVEAAYLQLMRGGISATPPLFLDQLVHLILRNTLDGCEDAFMLRAAELFFRPQRLTVHEGALLAADEEVLAGANPHGASPLVSMLGLPAGAAIDVLGDHNAASYWERSDRHDLALDLTAGRHGLVALGEVVERWTTHLLAVDIEVECIRQAVDLDFRWYVGMDQEGTAIGDRLWRGEALDDAVRSRIVGLYRAAVLDPAITVESAGAPIYLIAAMTPDGMFRMKPQNLLTGLPIRRPEAIP